MRLCLIISALCLTACAQTEPVIVTPHIPAALLQPVAVPVRDVTTVNQLAAGYVEARAALATANGRIGAIACIYEGDETCD